MRITLLASLLLFFAGLANAQNEYTIKIDASPKNIKPSNILITMLEYNGDTILYNGNSYLVTPPQSLTSKEVAFGFLSFQGHNNPTIPPGVLAMLDGYKGASTKLYIDKNYNFDLSDDGDPYELKDSLDQVRFRLLNPEIDGAFYEADVQFIQFPTDEHKEMLGKMVADSMPTFKGNVFIDHNYWLTETPQKYLIFEGVLDTDSVKLGLVDFNLNGLYNDRNNDKILIGNYHERSISDSPGKGRYTIKNVTVVEIEKKFYLLKEVEPTGKYIRLSTATKQEFDYYNNGILYKGAEIPDLTFKTFDGHTTSIHQELAPDKFTLIDLWGTWCKGCMIQTNKLKKLDNLYSDRLSIIGLNYEPNNTERAKEYAAKQQLRWLQGIADEEITMKLSVEGFPFYLLVDKNRKIRFIGNNLEEIENLMNKN